MEGYILDQKDPGFAAVKFGRASLAHGGCGAVAVHNALVTIGAASDLQSILDGLQRSHAPLLLGFLGTLPRRLRRYLENLGYRTEIAKNRETFDEYARSSRAVILWYTWHTHHRLGIHFFHLKPVEGGFLAYNLYSGQRAPIFLRSIPEFLRQETRFPARLICIN